MKYAAHLVVDQIQRSVACPCDVDISGVIIISEVRP